MTAISFTGLSAFPLTPMDEHGVDDRAFTRLVERLAVAGVDSIGALGSVGGYAYLDVAERGRLARLAVEAAGGVPVMVGIGALRTRDVQRLADDAQAAGAAALLLAPASYQPLTEEEVFGLYEEVGAAASVPLCVYDNPATTHFTFGDELHGRIAALPAVGAVKFPAPAPGTATERVAELRGLLPGSVALGVSSDPACAEAMVAGADVWFSAVGGLFPEPFLAICRAAAAGDRAAALAEAARLEPVWALVRRHGSVRVVAAAAAALGLTEATNLPRPVRELPPAARQELLAALDGLGLGAECA